MPEASTVANVEGSQQKERCSSVQIPPLVAWVGGKFSCSFFEMSHLVSWLHAKFAKTREEEASPRADSGTMEVTVHQRRPESRKVAVDGLEGQQQIKERCSFFQMPLHYPRYTKADYETMPEWRLDLLLAEYGLRVTGDVDEKRKFAIGAFIWPSH